MATQVLVGPDVSGGARLLEELERGQMPVIVAFWRYPTDDSGWRLIISSPLVDREGSLPVYRRVQAALQRLPDIRIPLSDVYAVGENDPVVRILRQATVPAHEAFNTTVTFPSYSPYAPYLPEDATSVGVYVYRSGSDSATASEHASVRAQVSAQDHAQSAEDAHVDTNSMGTRSSGLR